MSAVIAQLCMVAILLLTTSVVFSGRMRPIGGWRPANKSSIHVINATEFAVTQEFDLVNVDYEIISAYQQIVAGTKYNLTVAITDKSNSNCSMYEYIVLHNLYSCKDCPVYELLEDTATTGCPFPAIIAISPPPGQPGDQPPPLAGNFFLTFIA
jgi:hypothetical protein